MIMVYVVMVVLVLLMVSLILLGRKAGMELPEGKQKDIFKMKRKR